MIAVFGGPNGVYELTCGTLLVVGIVEVLLAGDQGLVAVSQLVSNLMTAAAPYEALKIDE